MNEVIYAKTLYDERCPGRVRRPSAALARPSIQRNMVHQMKELARRDLLALVLLVMFSLTGCSGGDTAESVSREIVANMKEMGAILNGITDEASAKAAVPKIEALRAKMRDAGQRAKKVPKIDSATEQKIGESMQAGVMEAMASIVAAQEKLSARPELLAIIEPAMKNMEDDL
jgi:hypothetical protein